MKQLFSLIGIVFISHFAHSQIISGYVMDVDDNGPIPFVSIYIEGTTTGTTSDIDGFFKLPVSVGEKLHFHTLGYFDTVINIASNATLTVKMETRTTQLKEAVIVAGINPAIAIVKKAIANRDLNNPEKNYPFTYTTYSKMVFGPNVAKETVDLNLTDSSTASDSSRYQFTQAMSRHYLFLTETVSERKFYPPNKSFENVVANRFSGLSNPNFTMVASEFQPFSYYSDYVDIIGLKYLSPLARNSYNDYVFELKDSIFKDQDTIYIINFQPKQGKIFNGLIGSFSINTNRYAIQNIKVKQAYPTSTMQISVEQMSEFIDGKQWFPVQFNTHILMKLDGGSNSNDDLGLDFFNARGKTYIKDIVIGGEISKKGFPNVQLELATDANKHDSTYWEAHRKQPLTQKESNTYTVIDSLGEDMNFDKKLLLLEAITTGEIPAGPVSFELDKFMDYNEFEGMRLGVGLRTNNRISKFVSVGGYAAYGFNDVHWKYGGDIKFKIYDKNDITAGLVYQNDVTPSGGVEFFETPSFELRSYSSIYVTRMDRVEGVHAYFTFRALRDFQNKVFYNSFSQSNNYPFEYVPKGDTLSAAGQAFQRAEVGWTLRFGLHEKYIRLFGKNISTGSKYPYLWLRIAKGDEALGGTFNYTKLDARITKTFLIKGLGKLGFQLEGGTIAGNVPSTFLHYGRGMRNSGFNLYIQNAFNTMAPNEFLSQTYLSGHIHHSFGPLYKNDFSALELSIISSAGWGTIDDPTAYLGDTFKTLEKGYFESGLLFDNVLVSGTSGIGFGVFYRYGPYALPKTEDNFGFSFTVLYVLQ